MLVSIKADEYWGAGFTARGKNKLGELLMKLRGQLIEKERAGSNWEEVADEEGDEEVYNETKLKCATEHPVTHSLPSFSSSYTSPPVSINADIFAEKS